MSGSLAGDIGLYARRHTRVTSDDYGSEYLYFLAQ